MNVVNPEAIEAYCAAVAAEFGTGTPGALWATAQLRRHVSRDPDMLVPVGAAGIRALVDGGLLASEPAWLEAALARGDALGAFDPSRPAPAGLRADLRNVVDWATGAPDEARGLVRMGVPGALEAAADWHRREARRRIRDLAQAMRVDERTAEALLARRDPRVAALFADDPDGVETVHAYPDGVHRMVRLTSKAALVREGTLLDHCVGSYAGKVEAGRCEILSMRDADGMPVLTIEVSEGTDEDLGTMAFARPYLDGVSGFVRQVRGLANSRPAAPHMAMAWDYLTARGHVPAMHDTSALARMVDARRLAADVDALAERDGIGPALRPGPRVRFALLACRESGVGPDTLKPLVDRLTPDPGLVGVEDRTSAMCGRTVMVSTVMVPCGALVPAAAHAVATAPEGVLRGARAVAERVLALMAERPAAVFRIVGSAGERHPPEALFAAAGLLAEVTDARRRADAAARAHVAATMAAIRSALPRVPEAERGGLRNALAVTLPALAAEVAPRQAPPVPTLARRPPPEPPRRAAAVERMRERVGTAFRP